MAERTRLAGRWWEGDPYREEEVIFDAKGNRKILERESKSLGAEVSRTRGRKVYEEDHRVEVAVRIRKVRDEKVMKACGRVHEPKVPRLRTVGELEPCAALYTMSGYSYGRSSMLAEEIPALAAIKGLQGVLIADRFSLTAAFEISKISSKVGVKAMIGATIELPDGGELVLVARNRIGYQSLSRLLTECHLGEPRLFPLATWERLAKHTAGLSCITAGATSQPAYLVAQSNYCDARTYVEDLIGLYGRANVYLGIERSFLPYNERINNRLMELSEVLKVTPVAASPITHAQRDHFPVQDILACIHSLCTIEGFEERKPHRHPDQPQCRHIPTRSLNAERYLKSAHELNLLFKDHPELLRNGIRLMESCEDHVLPDRTDLPEFCENEEQTLKELVWERAKSDRAICYGVLGRIKEELDRINGLGFARHFLTAWEMCDWCNKNGVHFSARGSVVDSVVAHYLGMSRINAFHHNLHFDRFLPADGSKRPDIDIDFEAARRDEVRQHLSDRYGAEHVATVAAVGAYSTRGIVRAIGKVMDLPEGAVKYLAKRIHGGVSPEKLEAALEARPELRDSGISKEKFRWVFRLAERMTDIPINIRSHPCGVVISAKPIRDTVPVQHSGAEGVPIIQWDKRSSKHFFDKFDVLCLRGQDVLSDTEEFIKTQDLGFSVLDIPMNDEETYRAMRAGQLIGIPQSASPAMRQAHIRIGTKNLRDASLVQAGIRPGVGGAVKINELIARRRGKAFQYEHPLLEGILGHTYGIVVFQEQIDQLLQVFAGYSSGEAEDIRESIYKKRREEFAASVRDQVLKKIVGNGFAQAIAEMVYDLVRAFEGYGFAEGHALAFADISIRCIYLQQNHPAPYFAALLNAQPAGYYGPVTITNEARIRGITILPPDVNRSQERFSVEAIRTGDPALVIPASGIRVGFSQISGLSQPTKEHLLREQSKQEFESFFDFVVRVRPNRDELESLIMVGALDNLHPNRRALLWAIPDAISHADQVNGLREGSLPLLFAEPLLRDNIADFSPKEKAIHERRILDHDIPFHLMAFERERVRAKGGVPAAEANQLKPGTKAMIVGNPIRLRFPPTKSGKRVVFFDLQDESGLANVTCFDATYIKYGHAIVCSQYVTILGQAQDRDGHIAFLAEKVFAYHPSLRDGLPKDMNLPIKAGDYLVG